jgi:hypothetical protein
MWGSLFGFGSGWRLTLGRGIGRGGTALGFLVRGILTDGSGAAIERGNDALLEDLRFGFDPVIQGLAFRLSPLLVELLGTFAYLALEHADHELLLLLPACDDIHGNS